MGAENDQYIDTVVVDLSALTPSNTITPITAYSGLLGHAVFNMSFRLVCSANYYGDNCSKFCEGRYNDLGHYRCDEQGNIVCKTGYTDESTNCVQCIPLTNCCKQSAVSMLLLCQQSIYLYLQLLTVDTVTILGSACVIQDTMACCVKMVS